MPSLSVPDHAPAPGKLSVTATLGPACAPAATLDRLLPLVDRLRLNASHLAAGEVDAWLARLAALFTATGRTLPVVVDLQGAKMRLGRFEARPELPPELELRLADERPAEGSDDWLPVPHPELFERARTGESLSLADGRVLLRVLRAGAQSLVCRVERSGPVGPRQGVNRREHPVPWREVTPGDRRALSEALPYPFVELACSFTLDGREAELLRASGASGRHLVAKIERPEAFAHLEAVAAAFDELWLCRGDLGEQAGLRQLGALQRRFAAALPDLGRPAMLAGQVLHHTTVAPAPTRAEVVQLHDLASQGFAGVVLSDETAVGAHPLAALEFLADWTA